MHGCGTVAHLHKFFCRFVASVDSFLAVICRHIPTVARSLLEAQSVGLQASEVPVGAFVLLPTLWRFNGAGIAEGRQRMRLGGKNSIGRGKRSEKAALVSKGPT
jgi:hypothetical protein